MDSSQQNLLPATPPSLTGELRAQLHSVEQRDWSLWGTTILVVLLLTAAVVSLSLPGPPVPHDPFYQLNLNLAVRGLSGLALLFSLYVIHQQLLIKGLRKQLTDQIEKTLHEQARAEAFYKLAMLDPLTGLHNRRYAEERLEAELSRSQRHSYPLTVLTVDLDDFKQINDRYGHQAGDVVLQEFAQLLRKVCRGSDLPARLGGDEFILLLPECRLDQVGRILGRLGPLQVDFEGQSIPVTFSAGWADLQADELPEQLLKRADEVLYANKRVRRENKAVLSSLR